jgi:cupin 2 domain-containing protein
MSDPAPEEQVDVLVRTSTVRIERIVSHGHRSPEGFWYDQDRNEWVVVLRGGAGVLFEGESSPRVLDPGDTLTIPAHTRHRVEWTSPGEDTVWLAVFYA